MFKVISHVLIFAVGAGVGVWWGVNNPKDAANLASIEQAKIQQAVALAKQQVLQKVVSDQSKTPADASAPGTATSPTGSGMNIHLPEYKQMLQNTQQELNDAKAKLSSAGQ